MPRASRCRNCDAGTMTARPSVHVSDASAAARRRLFGAAAAARCRLRCRLRRMPTHEKRNASTGARTRVCSGLRGAEAARAGAGTRMAGDQGGGGAEGAQPCAIRLAQGPAGPAAGQAQAARHRTTAFRCVRRNGTRLRRQSCRAFMV